MIKSKFSSPTPWLFIDAAGALLTAFTHGFVLRSWLPFTGMPASVLGFLAMMASGLAVYSTVSWLLASREVIPRARAGQLLRIVALANVLFCLTLVVLLFVHSADISAFGYLYFMAEIVVVLLLVNKEWRVGLAQMRWAAR